MKKTITYIALGFILSSGVAVAQDSTSTEGSTSSSSLKSKRGFEILPQAGDWAIGLSASGSLYYVGNLFNGSDDNEADDIFDYSNSPRILNNFSDGMNFFGKKFIDANNAYRVRLNVLTASDSYSYSVLKDEVTPDVNYPSYVEDVVKYSRSGFTLGLGKEKRRGSHRIQGVYGAEALLGLYSYKQSYDYGNDLNLDFPIASTAIGSYKFGVRLIESKSGSTFFIGARGFIGAEYFFAPKMSIGGEFGYTLGYATEGKGLSTYERYDALTNSVVEVKRKEYSGVQKYVGLSPDNLNAAVNLFLYF